MNMRQISVQDENLPGKAVHGQNRVLEGQDLPVPGVSESAMSSQEYCRNHWSSEQTDERDDFTVQGTPSPVPPNMRCQLSECRGWQPFVTLQCGK